MFSVPAHCQEKLEFSCSRWCRRSFRTCSNCRCASSCLRIRSNSAHRSPQQGRAGSPAARFPPGAAWSWFPLPWRVLGAQELRTQPSEDVIGDRFGIGNLRVAGPAAGFEADVAELVHQELERNAVLQVVADGGCEAIHQAGNGGAFLCHGDENFAGRAVLIQADGYVAFMAADGELVR